MHHTSNTARIALSAVATAAILAGLYRPALAQEAPEKSLYERLGGVYPIAVVVDDFIDRLLVNDELNANPAIAEARARVPAPGLKYRVIELTCQATGGPCTYTGRSMVEAHTHLGITEREWQVMIEEFKKSLAKFQVPAKEQGELIAILESVKDQIVLGGTGR